jgi:hypothetical protein
MRVDRSAQVSRGSGTWLQRLKLALELEDLSDPYVRGPIGRGIQELCEMRPAERFMREGRCAW